MISGHGYGHSAMTAPLINTLQQRHPDLKVTLRSGTPLAMLRRKFKHPFDCLPDSVDFGMRMHNAFTVDIHKSLSQYQYNHQHWQKRIDTEKALLTQLGAYILLSNIAYLPLLAARQLGLPAVAYGCLNWAEIFQHFFPDEEHIYKQMMAAYGSADCVIRTEPGMPMTGLDSEQIGPIAATGQNRRSELLEALGLEKEVRLVLVSMGGIRTDIQPVNWPALEGVHYLIPDASPTNRPDITPLATTKFSFSDALCSCDILLTKPGYGSFTEAAINRKAVLYVKRPDWPESPYLCNWLTRHNPCRGISEAQLNSGDFSDELNTLLQQPITPDSPSSGLSSAIKLLETHFKLHKITPSQ